jgi:hypothetical protein
MEDQEVISSLILAAACGSVCQQSVVVRQKAVYAVPYVAPAQVFYFVGSQIRSEAIVQKQMQEDPEYQEFLEFRAWKQRQAQTAAEAPPEPVQQNAVQRQCASCHGSAEPKGSYYLDGTSGMSAEAITKAIRMIAADKMPPPESGHRLTREEKNELLNTLLSLEANGEPPPEPEPNPQGGSQ